MDTSNPLTTKRLTHREMLLLLVLGGGVFLDTLDLSLVLGGVVFLDTLVLSLVPVALPSIGSALHLPEAQLQWIVSAFVLGYGGFLLFGGRTADILGRKRVLVCGLAALIAASILGTVATDGTLLIAAR